MSDSVSCPQCNVVTITASLGALRTLCRLTDLLPANLNAAVIVMLHTAPMSSIEVLVEIVRRYCALQVCSCQVGDCLTSGHVYLAPANRQLVITSSGHIRLDTLPAAKSARPSADLLFQSVAKVYGRHVIGIILSGPGHDGAAGLYAIKAMGGITVVQQPAQAVNPDMPLHALKVCNVDYCVPLAEMGALLISLVNETLQEALQTLGQEQV